MPAQYHFMTSNLALTGSPQELTRNISAARKQCRAATQRFRWPDSNCKLLKRAFCKAHHHSHIVNTVSARLIEQPILNVTIIALAQQAGNGSISYCSLLYPCFKTALRYGVVSGCFVDGVSPSPPLRPELAPERGLEGSELAFRTPESARKIHAKSFGP